MARSAREISRRGNRFQINCKRRGAFGTVRRSSRRKACCWGYSSSIRWLDSENAWFAVLATLNLNRFLMRARTARHFSALAFFLAVPLPAQMYVARNVEARSFADSAAVGGFSGATNAFAEWQRGYGSNGGEQTWDVKVGITVDVVRWGPHSGISASLNGELLANPYNSNHFNPRGVYLEPVLGITQRIAGFDWQLAAFHRCRHDVDNIDPADDRSAATDATRYKRVVILSGLQFGIGAKPVSLGHLATALVAGNIEVYPVRFEERRPADEEGLRWNHALASLTLGGRVGREITKSVEPYVRGWTTMVMFHAPNKVMAVSS